VPRPLDAARMYDNWLHVHHNISPLILCFCGVDLRREVGWKSKGLPGPDRVILAFRVSCEGEWDYLTAGQEDTPRNLRREVPIWCREGKGGWVKTEKQAATNEPGRMRRAPPHQHFSQFVPEICDVDAPGLRSAELSRHTRSPIACFALRLNGACSA
jgi:hypothetical protein